MTTTPTIVLLGGSGLGPWAWERVTPLLNDRGLRTMTPQLRGTGDDPTSAPDISLDEWIDDVATFLDEQVTDGAVLVAHSFAGYIAAGLLERNPSAVDTLVFLDAVLPQPEQSWFDVMGQDAKTFMFSLAEDGAIPFFTRQQLDQVYPEHGINDTDWAWMHPQLTPQPLRTYARPAITRPLDPHEARLAYVRCLNTAPPAAEVTQSTPGWTFRTLPTGHWPMITAPDAAANIIHELATL